MTEPWRPLRVSYVCMEFPKLSETFAVEDLRTLRTLGVDVTVHALRPARRAAMAMLGEKELVDLPLYRGSMVRHVLGAVAVARRPLAAGRLVRWILGTSRRPSDLVKSLVLAPRALGILRELRHHRPDVVHLFWGHLPSLVGRLVLREAPELRLSMFLGAYDLAIGYGGTASVARQADVVWTHAKVNVPSLRQMGVSPERIRVVYRGIDVEGVKKRAGDLPREPGRVIAAGRLIPAKGMDDVLRAFARVSAVMPSTKLVMIGEGPEKRYLVSLAGRLGISERVRFRGHLEHARLIREMGQAEAMLFLSRKSSERLPNVVKEAMAVGCACVVSETPGIRELVPGPDRGRVVRVGDVEGAASELIAILSGSSLREKLATHAADYIARNFDVRTSMRAYVSGWREILKDGCHTR